LLLNSQLGRDPLSSAETREIVGRFQNPRLTI
jgi:hypothetical protein